MRVQIEVIRPRIVVTFETDNEDVEQAAYDWMDGQDFSKEFGRVDDYYPLRMRVLDVHEPRRCDVCGQVLEQGFTDGDAYCCEEHFEQWMCDKFGTWRPNDHDGGPWDGGYYDWYDVREGVWHDTEVYWTEWED